MRLHRFIGDFDLSKEYLKISDRDLVNQLKNVFRLKTGDEILLGDGKKNEALACVEEISRGAATLIIKRTQENTNEPEIYGILYCSILKKENFELAAQKAVEAGISEIVPIIGQRTVKTAINLPRLEKIVKEAAEQSGRGIIPKVHPTLSFEKAFEHASTNNANIFFRPSGLPIAKIKILPPKVGIFIGPEGGWNELETESAEKNQFTMASLGKLILRAETAASIASYLVLNR
ncbi:MAG: RsmE family RNA methyltransferase [bacterium]|nr:RsmE family RNA methyltransferase [bacterium]